MGVFSFLFSEKGSQIAALLSQYFTEYENEDRGINFSILQTHFRLEDGFMSLNIIVKKIHVRIGENNSLGAILEV